MQSETPQPQTLIELLEARASALGEKLVYRFLTEGEVDGPQESESYQRLSLRAKAIGAFLQAEGQPGDRAVLLYVPGIDYIEGFLGAQYGGLIPVPAYPPDLSRLERSLPRLRAILSDCQAKFVLTTRPLLELAEGFFSLSPELAEPRWIATDELDLALSERWHAPKLKGDDIAFLQYTSGSTGEPKGVMVTHHNMLANFEMGRVNAPSGGEPMRLVSWLPPYHDLGLLAMLLPIYAEGEATLFSPLDFLARPLRWLEAISRFRATLSGGPNFAYDLCARKATEAALRGLDLSSWTVAFNGAEPIRAETIARFNKVFEGIGYSPETNCPGYGLAEATLLVSAGRPLRGAKITAFEPEALTLGLAKPAPTGRPLVSCGVACVGQRAIIVAPTSRRALPDGQIGEIWIEGESVARGYWQKPALNEEVFGALLDTGEGPFLRSGDLGFYYDGELYISGRQKDLIIIRGKNHPPQDLEQTAERAHQAIRPGCVTAFPIERGGVEVLGLVAEVDPRKLTDATALFEALQRAIAELHEVPLTAAWLIAPGSIAKTSSGKLQRYAMRRAAQDGSLEHLYAWEAATTTPKEPHEAPSDASPGSPEEAALQIFLLGWIAASRGVPAESLRVDAPLSRYGLDSVFAVELRLALEKELGRTLSNSLVWSYPSIQALAHHLSQANAPSQEGAPQLKLAPTQAEQTYPLSFTEQGLWRLLERQPRQEVYNLFLALRSTKALQHATLEEALRLLIARQESLRTGFYKDGGAPVRRVWERVACSLPREDLSHLQAAERDAAVAHHCSQMRHHTFELQAPPLLAARLLHLSPQEDLLLISISHLIADAWSMGVLWRELSALYESLRAAQPAELSPLTIGPASYAVAAEEALRGLTARGEGAYPPYPAASYRFPYDRPLPGSPSIEGSLYGVWVDDALKERLTRAGQEGGFSVSSAFLVAFQVALHRLSRQEEVLFSVVQGNRLLAPLRGLIGYFVFAELFYGELRGAPTYLELLQTGLRFVMQERPSEQPRVFLTQPQQMRIVFNFHNVPEALQVGPSSLFAPALELQRATYLWDIHDLLMQLIPSPGGIYCQAAYRHEVINAATMERVGELLLQSLEEIAEDPRQRVSIDVQPKK